MVSGCSPSGDLEVCPITGVLSKTTLRSILYLKIQVVVVSGLLVRKDCKCSTSISSIYHLEIHLFKLTTSEQWYAGFLSFDGICLRRIRCHRTRYCCHDCGSSSLAAQKKVLAHKLGHFGIYLKPSIRDCREKFSLVELNHMIYKTSNILKFFSLQAL